MAKKRSRSALAAAVDKVIPDLIIACARRPRLLRALAQLSREDQLHLYKKGIVVGFGLRDGTTRTRTVPLTELTPNEIDVAFDGPRIRLPQEQARHHHEGPVEIVEQTLEEFRVETVVMPVEDGVNVENIEMPQEEDT